MWTEAHDHLFEKVAIKTYRAYEMLAGGTGKRYKKLLNEHMRLKKHPKVGHLYPELHENTNVKAGFHKEILRGLREMKDKAATASASNKDKLKKSLVVGAAGAAVGAPAGYLAGKNSNSDVS